MLEDTLPVTRCITYSGIGTRADPEGIRGVQLNPFLFQNFGYSLDPVFPKYWHTLPLYHILLKNSKNSILLANDVSRLAG